MSKLAHARMRRSVDNALERSADRDHPAPPRPRFPETGATNSQPDFSRREFALPELLDEPCTFADWAAASRDLARLNRWTRGYRPTLDFLHRLVQRTGVADEPLHILDVGCGHGDTLRHVRRWAARRSLPFRLTGVDRNPYAVRLARLCDREEHIPADAIAWLTGDIFAPNLLDRLERPPDIVLCSLFTHHLDDPDVVRFLRWSEQHARIAWFISDLERSERAARLYRPIATVLCAHRFLRHDGPVSFRRAFLREDWAAMLRDARVEARVFAERPAKLCVERIKA